MDTLIRQDNPKVSRSPTGARARQRPDLPLGEESLLHRDCTWNVVDFRGIAESSCFYAPGPKGGGGALIFFLSLFSLIMTVVLGGCHSPCLFEVNIRVCFTR